jgi:hypothetical protein
MGGGMVGSTVGGRVSGMGSRVGGMVGSTVGGRVSGMGSRVGGMGGSMQPDSRSNT